MFSEKVEPSILLAESIICFVFSFFAIKARSGVYRVLPAYIFILPYIPLSEIIRIIMQFYVSQSPLAKKAHWLSNYF